MEIKYRNMELLDKNIKKENMDKIVIKMLQL